MINAAVIARGWTILDADGESVSPILFQDEASATETLTALRVEFPDDTRNYSVAPAELISRKIFLPAALHCRRGATLPGDK